MGKGIYKYANDKNTKFARGDAGGRLPRLNAEAEKHSAWIVEIG